MPGKENNEMLILTGLSKYVVDLQGLYSWPLKDQVKSIIFSNWRIPSKRIEEMGMGM